MPDLLTTRQLAEYLQLSERSVYRLLERGEVPAVKVGGQWRFRKSAVDEWLDLGSAQLIGGGAGEADTSRASEDPGAAGGRAVPGIAGLLNPDNIVLDLPAGSKAEVLATFVERLVLPEPVNRALLLARLLERESLCSTAVADGIAVPHTQRGPQQWLLRHHDLLAIGRTREGVDFGALDGKATTVLVLVLARDERSHLVILAKVARLAREPAVHTALRTADAAAIRDVLRRTEAALFQPVAAGA